MYFIFLKHYPLEMGVACVYAVVQWWGYGMLEKHCSMNQSSKYMIGYNISMPRTWPNAL